MLAGSNDLANSIMCFARRRAIDLVSRDFPLGFEMTTVAFAKMIAKMIENKPYVQKVPEQRLKENFG